MEKGMQLSMPSGKQLLDTLTIALGEMAIARGSKPDASTLKVYSKRLAKSKERLDDLLAAIDKIGQLPRGEGELAFPEVGAIEALAVVMRIARRNRERTEAEYYQQQQCPSCKGVVGTTRPRGEQLRTWCAVCQRYRKIVPEDQSLTDGEWALLCMELDTIYRNWKANGSKPSECVDPQFDRENVRGRAA
jgi:hypothetical protein